MKPGRWSMGHQRLGRLPRTRHWQQVVNLISAGADLRDVAAAASAAAEQQMSNAGNDPIISHSFWLLTQIVIAARAPDFSQALRSLGLPVDRPTLLRLTTEIVSEIDRYAAVTGERSDLGEMAELSAAESLSAVAGRQSNDLFGASPERTRNALAGLATARQFPVLARDFFTRLTRRQFSYFLSRELSRHVGANSRFRTTQDHQLFEAALDRHCQEATRIIEEFSGHWLRKRMIEGQLSEEEARGFVHIAFKKIRAEMEKRRVHDAAAA
jgi:hypothetical protein